MRVYTVSIAESLPRRNYALRVEYWYYTNKRAAKLKFKEVCKEHNYKNTTCENCRFGKDYLHRVNNSQGYNILEVYMDSMDRDELPRHSVEYRGF